VGPSVNDYSEKIQKVLFDAGYQTEVDLDAGDSLNKKIRNAQLAQFNFILVLGDREKAAGTVNVRTRDNKVLGERSVEQLLARLKELTETRSLSSEDSFE
jgi:threonyl-tRNA synthetase